MIPYQVKAGKLSGTDLKEVHKKAMESYGNIKRGTKRKPYVRSAYFNKQKVFFDFFWLHLGQKNVPEKTRRLKYFKAGVELIRYCRNHPATEENPNKPSELLHRFAGLTKDKEKFFVQIKEHKRTGKKQLMSIFPAK